MSTLIERIISDHSRGRARPNDIVDVDIDARVARDFGGANVVKNVREFGLGIDDPERTFFTFDCNPGGSDQKYATNQQLCREFAREWGIKVYDIDRGIGTHIAIDDGLVRPGGTFVSTDSHANIMGAICAFGQGMGDVDIASAFSDGKVWFKVPPTVRIRLEGKPGPLATAKDVTLAMLGDLGASGLLGFAAETCGRYVDKTSLSDRITIASMCTEMGGIINLFAPNDRVLEELGLTSGAVESLRPDEGAPYERTLSIDIQDLGPMVSRPGHPEDVIPVSDVKETKIGSAFIGSCTNGRYEDMLEAAGVLKGNEVAPGVVLKIVPSTREVWERCLKEGLLEIFMEAGALIGNAGCAGCAAGQIGQNGPGETTISTGNRNYKGKQGKGSVYLASPATVAASALAGYITSRDSVPKAPTLFELGAGKRTEKTVLETAGGKGTVFEGRAWYIPVDNIDTDMIYHNRHLTVTDPGEMGQYTFGNLEGYEDFSKKVKEGDIVVVGRNFGAGSSRQQAVECFRSLGVSIILAGSFGAIYERNAINSAMPIMKYHDKGDWVETGDRLKVDIESGEIFNITKDIKMKGEPFSSVQMEIYGRGGLLNKNGDG